MMSKIFFYAFVALSVVALSESLQCYECSGPAGSDCARGIISAMTVKTCADDEKLCYSVDITGAWTGRSISRRCIAPSSKCETLKHAQDIGVSACVECGEDLCNRVAIGVSK